MQYFLSSCGVWGESKASIVSGSARTVLTLCCRNIMCKHRVLQKTHCHSNRHATTRIPVIPFIISSRMMHWGRRLTFSWHDLKWGCSVRRQYSEFLLSRCRILQHFMKSLGSMRGGFLVQSTDRERDQKKKKNNTWWAHVVVLIRCQSQLITALLPVFWSFIWLINGVQEGKKKGKKIRYNAFGSMNHFILQFMLSDHHISF